MLLPIRQCLPFFLFLTAMLVGPVFAVSVGNDAPVWRPVTPEELQMTSAKVEPGADAEAIFWEVHIDDKKTDKLSYEHYVRVKIFTEKGRDKFSKFDIPFEKGDKVEDVAARVIRPDGSIVELNPNDVFEQEIVKVDKVKIKAKSFAVPGIAPGVIVEYQYRQVFKNEDAGGKKLLFQRDIPVQQMTYFIRPSKGSSLKAVYNNMPQIKFTPDDDGFYAARMSNIPAFREEPHMPPADSMRSWALLKYGDSDFRSDLLFTVGFEALLQRAFKSNKVIKAKADELTAGASNDEEKARRIYSFVQNNIKNLSFDSQWTEEQISKQKIEDPEDVLKKSMGSYFMIDVLFAALLHEAGLETRLIMAGDRSRNLYASNQQPSISEMHPAGFAVQLQTHYKLANPGVPYLPFGKLFWFEEGAPAYLMGDQGSVFVKTPISSPAESFVRRNAQFQLSEDGTLEGTVKIEYDGQQAISRRRDEFKDTQTEREEAIKDEIKKLSSSVEIASVNIENFPDDTKPLTYRIKVRIPNYASKTGKRLFVQPGFFEYGSTPLFTSKERKYSVWFAFPWSEQDDIEIKLPKGYALDSADQPADVADANNIGSLKIKMSFDPASNSLKMHRNFYFGGNGYFVFPVDLYPTIKELFEQFQKADTHIIPLKQTGN